MLELVTISIMYVKQSELFLESSGVFLYKTSFGLFIKTSLKQSYFKQTMYLKFKQAVIRVILTMNVIIIVEKASKMENPQTEQENICAIKWKFFQLVFNFDSYL